MCNNIKWLIFSIRLSCRCVQIYYRQEEKNFAGFSIMIWKVVSLMAWIKLD